MLENANIVKEILGKCVSSAGKDCDWDGEKQEVVWLCKRTKTEGVEVHLLVHEKRVSAAVVFLLNQHLLF